MVLKLNEGRSQQGVLRGHLQYAVLSGWWSSEAKFGGWMGWLDHVTLVRRVCVADPFTSTGNVAEIDAVRGMQTFEVYVVMI